MQTKYAKNLKKGDLMWTSEKGRMVKSQVIRVETNPLPKHWIKEGVVRVWVSHSTYGEIGHLMMAEQVIVLADEKSGLDMSNLP